MNPNEITRRFPRASVDFCKANAGSNNQTTVAVKAEESTIKVAMKLGESTDIQKLNKTERGFYEILRMQGHQWIGVQSVTLKLADDCRYTCDFMCLTKLGEFHGYEVKGFFRDDAKVKIKVAARMFPWVKFFVVMKEDGRFGYREVKV